MIPMLAPWEGRYVIHPCISKLQFQFQILPFALQFLQWMHHYHRVTILVHWSPKAKDKRGDEITWCVVTSLGWCPGKTNSTWPHSHLKCLQQKALAVTESMYCVTPLWAPLWLGALTCKPVCTSLQPTHTANSYITYLVLIFFLAVQTFSLNIFYRRKHQGETGSSQ